MHITPPNDSAKLTSLNQPKELQQAEKPVTETEPSNRIEPIGDEREHQNRKHEERRQMQRRQNQGQAMLDTRNPHERRNETRREDDRELKEETPPSPTQGIDVTA